MVALVTLTHSVRVRILFPLPRRNKVRFVPTFFVKKSRHLLPCSSFFTEGHAQVGYSLVNALYNAFVSLPTFCERTFCINEDSKRTVVNFVPVARKSREPAFGAEKESCSDFAAKRIALLDIK